MAKVKIARTQRPTPGRVVVPPSWSRSSSYPSNGLTPERLTTILRSADEGDVSRQMELFAEMEEKDPHISSQLQTRKNAVTGLEWEVIPWSDDPQDKAVADFVDSVLSNIRNWTDIEFDLLDAIGKGIAVSEIVWGYDHQGWTVPKEIIYIPQKLLLWDSNDDMRVVTEDAPTGKLLEPNKYIVHKYKARSGHPARGGVLRVCAWMYLFKNYTIKDWVAFAEVYGMPLRLGKYSASASEDDKKALVKALISLGSDAAGMVPDTAMIEFIEAQKQTSVDVYRMLARYCDEQTSKAIVGQTLTADSGGGSYAQSKTHDEVRHDLTVADCRALASTLQDDLIRPLVLYNFGHEDRLPSIHFACEIPDDLAAHSKMLTELVAIGVPIPLPYIYNKFGIPTPQAGEATTAKLQPQLQPFAYKLALKDKPREDYQQIVENLVENAVESGAGILSKAWEPLKEQLLRCKSLEEALAQLDDPETASELLSRMEQAELQQLLANTMLAANLIGRVREHV